MQIQHDHRRRCDKQGPGRVPGLWPLHIGNALMHSGIIHFHAQVICPRYEVAAPSDVLYGAFPRVQNGILAAKPSLQKPGHRLYLAALQQVYSEVWHAVSLPA